MRRDEEAAGLPELSFASFRKGGFTEFGDAEATDQEVLAQGGHRTCQMLTVYPKGTGPPGRPASAAPGASSR